ncbi:MAG: hypothetical protein HPY54_04330 [Chthonomonadetes bacterium]|nr:hypothetical protein [Chthonomonadetes bacterium]
MLRTYADWLHRNFCAVPISVVASAVKGGMHLERIAGEVRTDHEYSQLGLPRHSHLWLVSTEHCQQLLSQPDIQEEAVVEAGFIIYRDGDGRIWLGIEPREAEMEMPVDTMLERHVKPLFHILHGEEETAKLATTEYRIVRTTDDRLMEQHLNELVSHGWEITHFQAVIIQETRSTLFIALLRKKME